MKNFKTGVSIVVPCHNSEKFIKILISALIRQKGICNLPCEIIIVDNNSTDRTVSIVDRAKEDMPINIPLRVVSCSKPGAGWARKKGFSYVQYGVTIFFDDDNEPDPDWISRSYNVLMQYKSVGAVGGFNEPITEGTSPSWFYEFQSIYACGDQGNPGYVTDRGFLFGAGCALRSSLLNEIFYHQPSMILNGSMAGTISSGSDSELCARVLLMDYELFYNEKLRLKHHIRSDRLNWQYVIAKREASGASDVVLSVYRDFIFRRQPYDYELTVSYAQLHERSLFKKVHYSRDSEGNRAFASWRYANAKLRSLERLGLVQWNRMVEKLASEFLRDGYDTITTADDLEIECDGWEDLLKRDPVRFGRGIELSRIGYIFDARGNLHLCLDGTKVVHSSLNNIVLTTVDINGENIYWRKVSVASSHLSFKRFRLKAIIEKLKFDDSHYVGIRLGGCACSNQTRLVDQQGQRLLIELPKNGV